MRVLAVVLVACGEAEPEATGPECELVLTVEECEEADGPCHRCVEPGNPLAQPPIEDLVWFECGRGWTTLPAPWEDLEVWQYPTAEKQESEMYCHCAGSQYCG